MSYVKLPEPTTETYKVARLETHLVQYSVLFAPARSKPSFDTLQARQERSRGLKRVAGALRRAHEKRQATS